MDALAMISAGVATGIVSLTLTRSRPLRGIRNWIRYKSDWAGELVTCPYCMSHWIAGVLIWWLGPGSVKTWFLGTAVAIAIAAPVAAVVMQAILLVSPAQEEALYAESSINSR